MSRRDSVGDAHEGEVAWTWPVLGRRARRVAPSALYLLLAVATALAGIAGALSQVPRALAAPAAAVTPPDLQVTSLANPPSALPAGASFTVGDTTANKGQQAAGPSTTRFYLSLNKVKDTGDLLLVGGRTVSGLAAGKSSAGKTQVTVPLETATNTYFLLACADDLGMVPEGNETNNCRASGGTVRLAAGPTATPTLTPTATPAATSTSSATPVPTTTSSATRTPTS